MRGLSVALILLLVSPVAAGAWGKLPTTTAPAALELMPPPLPADLADGELIRLLAASEGLRLAPATIPRVPADASVASLALGLGQRAGAQITAEDVAAFDALDPRVAEPVALMLVAIDQAWTLRDAAFAAHAEELDGLVFDAADPPRIVLSPAQKESLFNAAILLADTLETAVLPQLHAAVAAGAWPPVAVADPVGVLRIGGSGDDVELLDRILQIDATGNDFYDNNAGGTTVADDLDPTTIDTPIALSIDLSGNDEYRDLTRATTLGAGFAGVGMLLDLSGDDVYRCRDFCLGGASSGLGLMRDVSGNDHYRAATRGFGAGGPLAIMREDQGDDNYSAAGISGGHADANSIGLLWERQGTEYYETRLSWSVFPFAFDGGRGWFADEGTEVDTYWDVPNGIALPLRCNDCRYRDGFPASAQGVDNAGGLAWILANRVP